jgi:H/ACA ribonucleoprotein complex subunit 4
VTGVLPIALEYATRVLQALLLEGKEYICVMQLHGDFSLETLESVVSEFIGEIFQRPPLRSSVKRRLRTRKIYSLDILEVDGRAVLLKVACQSGTYMRKLCHDLGEAIGCGAHMRELRRTRTGPFTEDTVFSLYDLLDAFSFWKEQGDSESLLEILRPMEDSLAFIPKIYVRDSAIDAICHGADLAVPGVLSLDTPIEKGGMAAVFSQKAEAVALGEVLMSAEEVLEKDHGLVCKTKRVLMPEGTYPRSWRSRSREG